MPIEFNCFNKSKKKKIVKNSLKFPLDLDDKKYYPECIKFGIYERAGLSLEKLGTAIVNNFNKNAQETANTNTRANQNISLSADGRTVVTDDLSATTRLSNTSQIGIPDVVGNLAGNLSNAVRGSFDNIESQSREVKLQIQNPTSRLVHSIYLQMPESLVYNEQIDWQGTDLGLVGALKDGTIGAGLAAGAMANAGKMLGGAAGSLLSVLPGIGSTAGVLIGTLLGGESGVSGGIESSFNVKANPYKEQTFQGVPFRPFEFSFNFRPRNETEVEEVDNIIRSFRAYSKPSFKQQGQGGVFAYPHEFLIEFLTLNKGTYSRNEYIPQIKYCICKSVNTNWTGQGWKSFRDGATVDITLTLSFEETEIVTQDDVLGTNDSVGDFSSFGGNF